MSDVILPNCKRIEVRSSPIDGFGVFATDDIAKGEVLEEIPFVLFPRYTQLGKQLFDMLHGQGYISSKEKYIENLRMNFRFKEPEKYYFKWFPPVALEGDQTAFTVLPLGFGPIYNTSNTDNNAGWQVKEKTFVFRAERDIKKDEEIRTFYGYFVTENGAIFNCDTVFNLGLDVIEGRVQCKMIRFATIEQFEQGKQNPIYMRLAQLFSESKTGSLFINRLSACLPNLEEKAAIDITPEFPLSAVYQKIFEFRQSQFPIIKINFEYENKMSGAKTIEPLLFRK
jgi:hypothetical protein